MCSVLKIGIYGENRDFFGEVEENVQSLFFNLDLSYDVIYLDNQLRITNPLDILFVNMSKLIHKASAKIENMLRNAGSHIVAIADNAEELLYAFKIKASTAMLRNNVKSNVVEALDEVVHDILKKDKIIIENYLEQYVVDVDDIYYIEAIGDNSIIVTRNRNYLSKKPLKYWDSSFSGCGFYRTHKSFLVALDKIKSVNDYDIIFKDYEEVVPLAVRRRKGLKEYMI